jgi:hypothetical protein
MNPICILKYTFKILLQPRTFVITVVSYGKPCLQLDLPAIFFQITIYSVFGFLLAILGLMGLHVLKKGKHGFLMKLLYSKVELEEQDRSTRIFLNILIIS